MFLLLIYLVFYSFIHLFNCILIYLSVCTCTYVLFVNVQLSYIYLLVHSFDNLLISLVSICNLCRQ